MRQRRPAPIATFPDLAGKVAVVTGGSKGIGAATCRQLAANGVKVAVLARHQAGIDAMVAELGGLGAEALGLSADCTDLASLAGARDRVVAELGPVDILVAFAGGFGAATPIEEISEEEWRFVIDSNLTSTFLTVKTFLPGMTARGEGSIVTMASNAARLLDIKLTASYAAAKAAIVMFTRHVAKEVGPRGVRVNCIAPATTMSERIVVLMPPERLEEIAALSPLGRIGIPEDTAAGVLYLVSESAGWITGITLDVAGGRIML
ncbi:MAG: SDR family NAD(P)-dependent oxidoreductase [Candidatus Dormibacteraceae bacterium]